jgi:hypothetical protein
MVSGVFRMRISAPELNQNRTVPAIAVDRIRLIDPRMAAMDHAAAAHPASARKSLIWLPHSVRSDA